MSDITFPADRSYTSEHEWILVAPGADLPDAPVRVGITAVAVDALGELVFVELPAIGDTVTVGESCGEVESTKTVSDLFPPVSGEITAVNTAAVDEPGLVNADPYGEGWLFEVRPSVAGELLTAAAYAEANGYKADGSAL